MKSLLTKIVLPLGVLVLCAAANADTRTVEVWSCTVNEGHSLDDVKSGNRDWLEFVNGNVDGGGIQSYVLTPVVGALGAFMYVDSFPSMAAWIATKEALTTEEGMAVEAALAKVAACESNTLHNSEET
ncbi:MAG: hypothetical protein WD795_02575 [Woeseia sp.]